MMIGVSVYVCVYVWKEKREDKKKEKTDDNIHTLTHLHPF